MPADGWSPKQAVYDEPERYTAIDDDLDFRRNFVNEILDLARRQCTHRSLTPPEVTTHRVQQCTNEAIAMVSNSANPLDRCDYLCGPCIITAVERVTDGHALIVQPLPKR